MCDTTETLVVLRGVGVRRIPPKLGRAVGTKVMSDPLVTNTSSLPTCVTVSNLIAVGQTVRAYLWRSAEKLDSSHPAFQGHFTVIGTDTDLSDTYDFVLTFHSNHGPFLYRFKDITRY